MIARMKFPYAGKVLAPGEAFEAEDEHVHVLSVFGRAQEAQEDKQKRKGYRRRDMTAEIPR